MADFEERWSEGAICSLAVGMKDSINTCKNQLFTALAAASTVKAADKTRLQLTDAQWAALITRRDKAQAVYDAIIAQGF